MRHISPRENHLLLDNECNRGSAFVGVVMGNIYESENVKGKR